MPDGQDQAQQQPQQPDQSDVGAMLAYGLLTAGELPASIARRATQALRGPRRVALQSTCLSEARWDPLTEHLDVTFVSGGSYTYYDVPENIFDELIKAQSIGSYFNSTIKHAYAG